MLSRSCGTGKFTRKRSYGLIGLIAVLMSLPGLRGVPCGAQTSTKYPGAAGQIIDKITVVGAKVLASSAVMVLSGARVGDFCTEQNLDELRSKLIETGMFGLHNPDDQDEWVRLRIDTVGYPAGHCELLVIVDENDKVTGVNITGSGPIPINELLPKLPTGAIYNTNQMLRDRRAIQDMYASKGYLMTYGGDFGIDPAHPGILNVSIVVSRVRDIRVSGNRMTRAFVIRRELNTREGGYYNRKELASDIHRLAELGLFSDLEPIVTPVTAGQVSVEVKLTEKKPRTYNAGSSFGGGTLSGFLEISDNNFRGQDELLGLHVESGLTADRHSYQASFVEPYIDRHGTSMTVNAFDAKSSIFSDSILGVSSTSGAGTYVQEKIGGSLLLRRRMSNGFELASSIKAENVRTDPLSLAGVNASVVQDGPLELAGFEVSHSTLDQRNNPVAGSLQKLSIAVGHTQLTSAVLNSQGSSVLGSHNFVRSGVDLQKFINLQSPRSDEHPDSDRRAIALRFQAGSSAGIMPFTEQYFLGGATGLRGYRDGRFWGQNMAAGTVEYRHPLARSFKGVLFMEAGDAWGGNYQDVSLQGFSQSGFKVHASTGLGVRVGTPAGLVRLDYGYGDEGGRVQFGIGYSF